MTDYRATCAYWRAAGLMPGDVMRGFGVEPSGNPGWGEVEIFVEIQGKKRLYNRLVMRAGARTFKEWRVREAA